LGISLDQTKYGEISNLFVLQVISICTQYFFTACFAFMLLESLHIYALVASVVKERGMLTRKQNLLVGLGLPFFVVLCNMCFEFDHYGGQYHCWLQMDTGGCNSYSFLEQNHEALIRDKANGISWLIEG
jgi:hypothetical protein